MSLLISGKSECIPRFNLCIWCYNWWNLCKEYEMSLYYLIRTRDTRLVPFFEDPSPGEIERKGSEKAHNHKCYQANLAK